MRSGASVSLECKVNGNPRPSVTWTRLHGSGQAPLESSVKHSLTNLGSVLTLHSVTRQASGEYLCSASNGVGSDATDKV